MRIFSWNVNGLRAVVKKNFYEFVEQYKPDVLCLQETRIPQKELAKIQLPFKYAQFGFSEKPGYAGTAILSNVKPLSMQSIRLENHPEEGRITRAEFDGFSLYSVYVPNSQDHLQRLDYREKCWDCDFRNYLAAESKTNGIVVCGDMNVAHTEIDLARPKDNTMSAGFTEQERRGMDLLLREVPLVDIWRKLNPEKTDKYSWWSFRGGARARNVGWRIDYFLVSPNLVGNVKNTDILDNVLGSDHCPLMLDI